MTILETIFARHSGKQSVKAGDITDIVIDARLARDFGGANVVKNLEENKLGVHDATKTFFTFDCNPTGSDQKYAANQQYCRNFARNHHITTYDIDAGIGTHLAIDMGLAVPGSTLVSTDSHANILGAIGAFGQGMGDQDIAAVWANGSIWFKVPESAKIILKGKMPAGISSKDVVLNLLSQFGANRLLGYSVEIYGEYANDLPLADRITISSMATEMGAIAIIFAPSQEIIDYCRQRSGKDFEPAYASVTAQYAEVFEIDVTQFSPKVSLPGNPEDTASIEDVRGTKIDSVFIGSCTNGRFEDLKAAADIFKGRKVAPGVVVKIVPSTDEVWKRCLNEGIISIFKEAGILFGNAGCAGCASGQIGQNGPGEITISTGNRNFAGKQGKGKVYLVSPEVAAASAIAGYITTPDQIPATPAVFTATPTSISTTALNNNAPIAAKPTVIEGKVWIIEKDNIDTDMIFHNRYLHITQIAEMGQYTFDNLAGWENYAKKSEVGDIVITGKNFGAGSSRQQAVDCFISLGNVAILAQSFGAIYERNAINAAFPVITYKNIDNLELRNRDTVRIDLEKGEITHLGNGKTAAISPFSEVQMDIYQKGGLLKPNYTNAPVC